MLRTATSSSRSPRCGTPGPESPEMAWTNPVDPVAGTVITVAYAKTDILDPLRWLRLMAGNNDPPGTGYVIRSDSVSATSWKTIPTILGYTPVNRAGDVMTGDLTVSRGSNTGGVMLGQTGGNVFIFNDGTYILLYGHPVNIQNNLIVGTGITTYGDITSYRSA